MRLLKLNQGTEEWHAFRRCHIGASDAPVIMGVNKYKSLEKLWNEKVNGIQEVENGYMARGKILENEALAYFENQMSSFWFPEVVLHEEYDWCSASLDGLEINHTAFVEIKCPGEKNHSLAKEGKVPEQYYPQIQHQFACTGLNTGFYFSYDGYEGCVVEVERNDKYIQEMLEREFEFWNLIKPHLEVLNA